MDDIEKDTSPQTFSLPGEAPSIREQFGEAFRYEGRVFGAIDVGLCVVRGFTEKVASIGARIVHKLV